MALVLQEGTTWAEGVGSAPAAMEPLKASTGSVLHPADVLILFF